MRPSPWFLWHTHLIHPGGRVLDFACGDGRHGLAAGKLGHKVIAVDRDTRQLARGWERAVEAGISIDWRELDLEGEWPEWGTFEAVLVFNYLDRASMPRILQLVAPGGLLIMETFLEGQRQAGWGPTSDNHLLRPGELARLVAPLRIVHGREAIEPVDSGQWRAVASIVAKKQ